MVLSAEERRTARENRKKLPEETFDKIRIDFLEKFKTKIENGEYHPNDLERIKKDSKWIRAFYKHASNNSDVCLNLIDEVLTWRKNFNANELVQPGKLLFPEELFLLGGSFVHNRDKEGLPIVHLIVKAHKKDRYPFDQVAKCMAYCMEKIYSFSLDNPIVLLIDMSDSGYANMVFNKDLELSKFLMSCLRTYYPGLIEYILIYDTPFVFRAIWSILKALLSARALSLINFVDKKSIQEFINEDQIRVHMGGKDTFQYKYEMGSIHTMDPMINI